MREKEDIGPRDFSGWGVKDIIVEVYQVFKIAMR